MSRFNIGDKVIVNSPLRHGYVFKGVIEDVISRVDDDIYVVFVEKNNLNIFINVLAASSI